MDVGEERKQVRDDVGKDDVDKRMQVRNARLGKRFSMRYQIVERKSKDVLNASAAQTRQRQEQNEDGDVGKDKGECR